jgi:hypothetical protein
LSTGLLRPVDKRHGFATGLQEFATDLPSFATGLRRPADKQRYFATSRSSLVEKRRYFATSLGYFATSLGKLVANSGRREGFFSRQVATPRRVPELSGDEKLDLRPPVSIACGRGRRVPVMAAVKRVVVAKAPGEPFGARGVIAEVSRRFAEPLRGALYRSGE